MEKKELKSTFDGMNGCGCNRYQSYSVCCHLMNFVNGGDGDDDDDDNDVTRVHLLLQA